MLIAKGVMAESGMTRKAKIMRHRKCGILTLAGFDADSCALDAWCDLAELSAQGEALALVGGRRTYEVHADRLNYRDAWSIKARPAGHIAVFASHRCTDPVPATWRLPARPTSPSTQQPINDNEGVQF